MEDGAESFTPVSCFNVKKKAREKKLNPSPSGIWQMTNRVGLTRVPVNGSGGDDKTYSILWSPTLSLYDPSADEG